MIPLYQCVWSYITKIGINVNTLVESQQNNNPTDNKEVEMEEFNQGGADGRTHPAIDKERFHASI